MHLMARSESWLRENILLLVQSREESLRVMTEETIEIVMLNLVSDQSWIFFLSNESVAWRKTV